MHDGVVRGGVRVAGAAAVAAAVAVAAATAAGLGLSLFDDPKEEPATATDDRLYTGRGAVAPEEMPEVVAAAAPTALAVPEDVPESLRPDGVDRPPAGPSGDAPSVVPFGMVLYGDPRLEDPLEGPYLVIERLPVPDCCGSSLPRDGEDGFRRIDLSASREGLVQERGGVVAVTFQHRATDTLVIGHGLSAREVARAAAAATAPPAAPQIPLDALPRRIVPLTAGASDLLQRSGRVTLSDIGGERVLSVQTFAGNRELEHLLRFRTSEAREKVLASPPAAVRAVGDHAALVASRGLSMEEVEAAADSLVLLPQAGWDALEATVMAAPPEFVAGDCGRATTVIVAGAVPAGLAPVPVGWAAGLTDAGVACAGAISPGGRIPHVGCGGGTYGGGAFDYQLVCGTAPPGTARVRVEDGYGNAIPARLSGPGSSAGAPFVVLLSPPARPPGPAIVFYGEDGSVIGEQLPPGVRAGDCPWTPHEEPCRVPAEVASRP